MSGFYEYFQTVDAIRVPQMPFRFFDKLKHEIRNKVLMFAPKLKLKQHKLNGFSIFKITEHCEIQI